MKGKKQGLFFQGLQLFTDIFPGILVLMAAPEVGLNQIGKEVSQQKQFFMDVVALFIYLGSDLFSNRVVNL
jgi:hypothetical protein